MSDSDKERQKYEDDVAYQVWRSGGNMGRINYDRVRGNYSAGRGARYAANVEVTAQQKSGMIESEDQRL